MVYPLGQTGINISPLGLGTVKFGRNVGVKYPQQFELPTDQHIKNLLACARDCGVNLLDTAPAYGTSETRLGQCWQGAREEWVLVSKAGEEFIDQHSAFDFSADHLKLSVERSLQRLKTDYLDVLLVHSDGRDQTIIEHDQVFETLAKLKQAGKIRAYGMSAKTVEGGVKTIEQADVVMVTYNPIHTEERAVIDAAHQHNKGVLIKKGFASGHIDTIGGQDPIQAACDFIFACPGVSSIVAGTLSLEHLQHNAQCAVKASATHRGSLQ